MFGGGKNLFLNVKTKLFGEEKLDLMNNKLRETQQRAQGASQSMGMVGAETKNAGDQADNAGGQFGKMFGVGMNLMFMGMAMQQVFGGLAGSMLKLVGVSQTFGAAAKSTLLPFFVAIAPVLNKIAFFFMNLPRSVKMVIGAFVAFMAVLGTFLFFGSQIALLAISLGTSILGLVAVLGQLVAGVFVVLGVIVGVMEAFKRWGKVIGSIVAIVIGTIALLVASVASAPVIVAAAVAAAFAALLTAVYKLRHDIIGAIQAIFDFFVDIAEQKIQQVKNIFNGLKKFFSAIGKILGGNFQEGIKQALAGLGEVIRNVINMSLPFGLTLSKIAGMIGSGLDAAGDVIGVNDFILTSGGKVLQPDKNDTIVGFNGDGPIQPGGGGGQTTVNVNDPVLKEDVDIDRLVQEIEDRINRDTRGRSGGLT